MFDYLQKFKNLPKSLRDKVSSKEVMVEIEALEEKYNVDMAAIIMKIMVKDISLDSLVSYFTNELQLTRINAEALVGELRKKVFFDIKEYLGIKNTDNSQTVFHSLPKQGKFEKPTSTKANFFFSPEDEEEIRQLSAKIVDFNTSDFSNDLIRKKLEKIIQEADISFGSELLASRFKKIIYSHLRGVRDKINTRLALKKSFEEGGLGFDNESVDKILLIVEKYSKFDEVVENSEPKKSAMPSLDRLINKKESIPGAILADRDLDYDISKLKKKAPVAEPEKKLESGPIKPQVVLDLEHELAPVPRIKKLLSRFPAKDKKTQVATRKVEIIKQPEKSIVSTPKEEKPKPTPVSESKVEKVLVTNKKSFKTPLKKSKPTSKPTRVATRINIPTSGKKVMSDVEKAPRVMSPINEITYMDLISFRRLADSPQAIIEKIKEKINLLEEDAYSKRLEGIKRWRNSLVNKLYLQIGHESIENNKSVEIVIGERKKAGKDYLNSEEFKAIMDLNKDLRF